MVFPYSYGWRYVLVAAGPDEAIHWRETEYGWSTAIPDLIFPADRSWLLTTLWDDDWSCTRGKRTAGEQSPQTCAARPTHPGSDGRAGGDAAWSRAVLTPPQARPSSGETVAQSAGIARDQLSRRRFGRASGCR
jgi:hypothetical protein